MVLGLLSEILVIDLPKYDIRSAHKSLIQLLHLLFKTTEKSLLCFSVAQGAHVSQPPPPFPPVLQPSTPFFFSPLNAFNCASLFSFGNKVLQSISNSNAGQLGRKRGFSFGK